MRIAHIMKAILVKEFGDASVCKLVADVPIPKVQSGEVLIRVHAAGVNPVETYVRSGTYTRLPQLPYTPGGDSAGVIEQVGANVTKFKAGDRVFTVRTISGSYAEYCVASADYVFPLPSNVSFEEGSALGVPYFTAYRALVFKGHAKPNEPC
jgi:NADPH2:quinone reductase